MEDKEKLNVETIYSANVTGLENAAHNDKLSKFNARQGHGYASEAGNDVIDKLKGNNSTILGDDNVKNGPDRMVDGRLIQSKYCQNATASVDAAFKNGVYRYYDANGTPMQLEVPKGQYSKAVERMQKHIAEGKVPGITDPKQAKDLIREGNIDYNTARNIAKAGNIDSLWFDSAHGMVIAANAFGISATITFAKAIWDGESPAKAVEMAMFNGLKFGGVAFVSSVISAQLTRTSLNSLLMSPSVTAVRMLPSEIRRNMLATMKSGARIYGAAATNNLAKLLRSNIIANTVLVLVMSTGDISNYFKGKISGKQLFKNIATLAAGLGGAGAGGVAGFLVAGIPGEIVGAMLGGIVSGTGVNKVLDDFIEDDAIEMVRIINERFVTLAQEYLLNEEEIDIVLEDLKKELEQGQLLEMFASQNREWFAEDMLRRIIEKKIVMQRPPIVLPSDNEFYEGMIRVLALAENNKDMQQLVQANFTKAKIAPKDIAKKLLPDKKISERSAKNAWYSTKNMNAVVTQQEECLQRMHNNEKTYREKSEENHIELEKLKNEVNDLMKKYE